MNCIVYLFQLSAIDEGFGIGTCSRNLINCRFALIPSEFSSGNYWQIISYGFLHATEGKFPFFLFHIIMNMYGLYALGSYLEPIIGKVRFTYLYFISLLGGGIMIVAFYFLKEQYGISVTNFPNAATIGASGAIFGLLVLFGLLYPDVHLLLIFFPIRAKNFTIVALGLGLVFEYLGILPISNAGHLGGALFGYAFYYIFLRSKIQNVIIRPIERNIEEIQEKQSVGFEESFLQQTNNNLKLVEQLDLIDSEQNKRQLLEKQQVEDANICPPGTFNKDDEYCLRCEWFANCMLRKIDTGE
ncbi:MAG: rhomboid family intramembrane serine protease [Spirochaetota bacterium]